MSIDSRLDGILKFKEENPGIDPNLFELADVAGQTLEMLRREAPNYGIHQNPEIYSEQKQTVEKYRKLQDNNSQALLNNDLGITKDSSLYKMIENLGANVNSYGVVPPYYSKLMGVKLYIAQQERAVRRGEQDKVVFDNVQELNYLRNELSKVYKMLLSEKQLTSISYPEIEVYREVFSVYINSIDKAEHDFILPAEYYVIENDLKRGRPAKTPEEVRAEWEAAYQARVAEEERNKAEAAAREQSKTKGQKMIGSLGDKLKGLVNTDKDFAKNMKSIKEQVQNKVKDFKREK